MLVDGRKIKLFADYSYVTFAVSTLALLISIFTGNPLLMLGSSVVLFSAMDAIGYFHLVWGGNQNVPANNQQERLVSYRFIQTVFQLLVSIALYSNVGLMSALSFNLMWWFGVCDILYYVLLKQNFFGYGDMFWLWWTPIGILRSIGLIKEITAWMAVTQAVIGVLVGMAILFI
jgi:hypothetical protein